MKTTIPMFLFVAKKTPTVRRPYVPNYEVAMRTAKCRARDACTRLADKLRKQLLIRR